ncbi:MAG: hypothetical protein QXN55_02265 [Candidatus Nitrosotenuis sp.]
MAVTDGRIFKYGDTIRLTIESTNTGPQKQVPSSSIRNVYPGIVSPCGQDYIDFAFLAGDHTNISSFDELAALKGNALNVVYDQPYDAYMCPFGYYKAVEKATLQTNSHDATITFNTPNGQLDVDRHLITVYEIQNLYGKTIREQVGPNEWRDYVESQTLPVGKYTIVAFTLSGEISKPLLIEVTDSKNTTIIGMSEGSSITQTSFFNPPNTGLLSLLTIPFAFGGVLMASRQNRNLSSSLKLGLVFAIVLSASMPLVGANNAFATYNVNSQGMDARSTTTSFKQATVEDRFEGIITDVQSINNPPPPGGLVGASVQNNQFVKNCNTTYCNGSLMWTQSVEKIETPDTATINSHSCTTQAGSFTCKLPSTVNVRGLYNAWTQQGAGGTCPSGFNPSVGYCGKVDQGSLWGVTISSTKTRLDLNTYQEIRTDGTIYTDAKYRTCTGSTCGAYSTAYTIPTPQPFGTSSSYYGSQSISGTTYYGTGVTVGECGTCNGGTGRANFKDGTYLTKLYVPNSGSYTLAYKAAGSWPGEQNQGICWWDTISSASSTTTARYTAGCQS